MASQRLTVVPITLLEANAFVTEHHRHHPPVVGHKFSVGAAVGDRIVGVVIVGRPVSRQRDDGLTLEVTRLCTDGHRNACSFLYGAAARAAFALGYRALGTYILAAEDGRSLAASGWRLIGEVRGRSWSCQSRPRVDTHPLQDKLLYEVAIEDRKVKSAAAWARPAAPVAAGVGVRGNKSIITAHAVIRWLERVEAVDTAALRRAAKRGGIRVDHDAQLLAYIEDNTDLDIARVKALLAGPRVLAALDMGAKSVRLGTMVAILRGGCVASIVPAVRNRRPGNYGSDIGRREESRRDRRGLLDAAE